MTGDIIIIGLLLALNGFFAMSELSIVSSSKPLLKQMARQGEKRAAIALDLAENPGRFLSTVQVGITLVGILAGAYGGATIAEKLAAYFNTYAFINPHGEAIAVALLVTTLTYFSVVVGELVPKRIALSNPERLACIAAPPMRVMSIVCTPIVKILDGSAHLILGSLGFKPGDEGRVTEAEVKAVIAEGVESGAIERNEHDMLKRIMLLDQRDVQSIMTHRVDVVAIDLNETPASIRAMLKEHGHSRYPVIDGDINSVLGVIHAKDFIDLPEDMDSIRPLVKDIPALSGNINCLKALELFKTSGAHMAIVIDEYGTTEGIVTAADLLEAIVGEMSVNYGSIEDAQIRQREDGSWLVDGLTPVDEIYLTLGLDAFDEDADYKTIAGFVIDDLGRAPEEGDKMEKFGYRFEVIDMDGRRIDKLLITKLDDTISMFN